jgi:hypothetical protein
MADDAGIFKWEMASRIILKGLPGIERSGYATLRNPEAINLYERNVLYLEPVIKRIHYRSGKADKRVTIDVISTAWNKIHCHITATERSMSQIFQSLCLNYKPLTKEEYLKNQEVPKEEKTTRYYKPYEQPSKFLDVGYDLIHVKGIPVEHWDKAEFDEWCDLMKKKFARLTFAQDKRAKSMAEEFRKLPSSTDKSEE